MFPRISSRLGQGVIALQLPSNLREAVRKYHDPPCRRRVQLAKLGSDCMNRSGYAIVALLPCRSCMGFVLEIAIMHLSRIKRTSFKCFLHLCASSLAVFHSHITRSHRFAESQFFSVSWVYLLVNSMFSAFYHMIILPVSPHLVQMPIRHGLISFA